jgi:hypothetical protein
LSLPFDLGRVPQVVGVQRRHELAPRGRESSIARGRYASIRLRQDPHPRIALGPSVDDSSSAISGSVVDDNDFSVAIGLAEG